MELHKKYYSKIIKNALKEDLNNTGDITSRAIFKDEEARFVLKAKDKGILCGIDTFIEVFKQIDKKVDVIFHHYDKDGINSGDIIAEIYGKVLSILQGERTAINFLSHLSGIATKTALFVKEAKGKLRILDTRKTLPAYRMLHKYAVNCGDGENHRIGLYDMILIKDNHIDSAGGITNAVSKVKNKWGNKYKIEVETRNTKEIEEALACSVDRIMLDNMTIDEMKKSVKLINKKAEIEASGNVILERIKEIAKTGVDFVSIGELTHTVKAFDFSLIKEDQQ